MITLEGVVKFVNNTASDGGAIKLVSYAQIRLADGLQAHFIQNKGRYYY